MAVKFDNETKYVGATLATFERNGYDDSDFLAIVWDAENGTTDVTLYDTTRFAGGGSATVDATEDVQCAARAHLAAKIAELNVADAYADAIVPVKGDEVRSLTTRGKNKGVVGIVKWIGDDKFNYNRYSATQPKVVGIKVEGEEKLRYLPLERVERTTAREVNEAQIAADAFRWAANANWRSLIGLGRGWC